MDKIQRGLIVGMKIIYHDGGYMEERGREGRSKVKIGIEKGRETGEAKRKGIRY